MTPPGEPALMPETNRLLRAREAQAELGMSRAKVYRMMQDGTLPIVLVDDCVRVLRRALAE